MIKYTIFMSNDCGSSGRMTESAWAEFQDALLHKDFIILPDAGKPEHATIINKEHIVCIEYEKVAEGQG